MMKIFRFFFLLFFVLCGCRGAEQGTNFPYQWENEPGPISFYPVSELKFAEKPNILFSRFGSGFFEEKQEPLQVSGQLNVTEDFSHLDTKTGIHFRSHKLNKPPFTLVDMSFGHEPHIIENIAQVQEIPSLTGQSAFLLTFQKKAENPLSGVLLSEDFDPEKMLYYQGSWYAVLDSFWLREKAFPKVWSGDVWHLEVDTQQEIPEYFVMKNQQKVGSFFSLPGAESLVYSFQVDDQGWWLSYQKTTKNSSKDDEFTWQFAFERNAEDLLEKYQLSEVMALTTIKNQIFFFFKTKEGQIGYWWNGHRYLTDFEEIEDAGCCAAPEVLISAEGKLRFLAKKDGFWQEFEGKFDEGAIDKI